MALVNLTRLRAAAAALCVALAGPVLADVSTEAQALHVLNRLSYGPAPGDVERVQRIGIERYIDEQLHPERLPLPGALTQRLDGLESTRLSQRELALRFRDAARAAKDDGENGKAMRRELVQRVALEAGEARLHRAIHSPRQLQEVMVDFWFNHFNIFIGKGPVRVMVENYEREAIRPHAMGRFRDLLGATARHPAMLVYLDNWLSAAPGYKPRRNAGSLGQATGLNENYARELMELHTLGVDGGYTQRDVTELARMFTGWTLNPRARGASLFHFDPRRHDPGDKEWLGRRVAARGQAEGEWALDVLASHPSTAHRVGHKLAQYFVADEPPPALVDRLARRFRDTDGDIRAVLKTLFDSAEFRDPKAQAAKFKTPYRYLVSSVRAAQLPVSNVRPLLATLYLLGMPLYGCQTPDGYKNTEAAWLNPDALTRRINFATAFASGKLPFARPTDDGDMVAAGKAADLKFNPAWATPPVDAGALLATLGGSISQRTRAEVVQAEPLLRAALLLGSPDFMRH